MIETEKTGWGTRLRCRPLEERRPEIEIVAEIEKPRSGRNSDIKIYFSGVTAQSPLRRTDMTLWRNCMTAILAEADDVAAKLQAAAKRSKPPSATKKRPKKP